MHEIGQLFPNGIEGDKFVGLFSFSIVFIVFLQS